MLSFTIRLLLFYTISLALYKEKSLLLTQLISGIGDRIGLLGLSRCHIITPTARLCSVPALLRDLLTSHSINFSRGVVHRVENGWGLTKMAVVLLNGLLW